MNESGGQTTAMRAGMRCRCPRCGEGALFKGFWTLDIRDRCKRCGLDYAFIDSGDGPAVFVIMILGFVILGSALALEFTLHPPIWVHGLLWIPATLFLAFGLLRPLKATLIALQYRNKAAEGRFAENGE